MPGYTKEFASASRGCPLLGARNSLLDVAIAAGARSCQHRQMSPRWPSLCRAPSSPRLDWGECFGIRGVAPLKQDLLTVVQEETGGAGVDLALECSGVAGSVANCLSAIRPLGRLTQVGHFGQEITLPYDLVAFRQIRITGSVEYTADSWRRSLQILAEGWIALADLITQRLPLSRWQEGFRAFEEGTELKVLLMP